MWVLEAGFVGSNPTSDMIFNLTRYIILDNLLNVSVPQFLYF